jgi:tetratricopeptide (TPR) repeat protein
MPNKITDELREIKKTIELQLEKTDEVIASQEAIADRIFEINSTFSSALDWLSRGMEDLAYVTETGFREVIEKLELLSEELKAIREILEKPLDTQAKELRKRAEFAYLNGWIDEAEKDLLEAEKKNYQDFIIHQILGNIYYYHRRNYSKALEYYQKAAKYAAPRSRKYAAKALICAARCYYQLGKVSYAYKSTSAALEMLPEDPHVLYHHARYAAKMGHEFVGLLKKCIYKDPDYLITADRDEIFSGVKEKIRKLAEDLRDEKRRDVDELLLEISSAKKEAEAAGITDFTFLDAQLAEINKLYARNSYFDFLKAEQVARRTLDESVSMWMEAKDASIRTLRDTLSNLESEANEWREKAKLDDWDYFAALQFFPSLILLLWFMEYLYYFMHYGGGFINFINWEVFESGHFIPFLMVTILFFVIPEVLTYISWWRPRANAKAKLRSIEAKIRETNVKIEKEEAARRRLSTLREKNYCNGTCAV